jgi:hypothetical protein
VRDPPRSVDDHDADGAFRAEPRGGGTRTAANVQRLAATILIALPSRASPYYWVLRIHVQNDGQMTVR